MSRDQTLTLFAAAVAFLLWTTLAAPRSAHADPPTTSQCEHFANWANKKGAEQAQVWIDARLAEGRTHILTHGQGILCAW